MNSQIHMVEEEHTILNNSSSNNIKILMIITNLIKGSKHNNSNRNSITLLNMVSIIQIIATRDIKMVMIGLKKIHKEFMKSK